MKLRISLRAAPVATLFFGMALFIGSVWFAGAARAACPGDAGEPLPARQEKDALAGLEARLAAMAQECGARAGYLAYRGAVLNALDRPGEAALLLEQALLFDPQRVGAQIDYAESLAALGDAASAVAMLRDALGRPDVPQGLRPRLQAQLDAIAASSRLDALGALPGLRILAAEGWQGAGTLTMKLGRDNNLNSAPARDQLTLTLPGGDAVFLLAERFRPRGGSATLAEAGGQLVRLLEGGAALQLHGEARLRDSPAASDTDYRQFQLGAAWSRPLDGGAVSLAAGATRLRYGGAELYRAERLSASREWRLRDCRPNLGFDAEWRSFPTAPELRGRFLGLSATVACGAGANRWLLVARNGRDGAAPGRAGGDQAQTDLRLVWTRPLLQGRLRADLTWYQQRDAGSYSPLLEGGANRRLSRTGASVEYAYPITPGWSLVASYEGSAQRSNLGLFDISGRALYFGLRWESQPQNRP